ncbi:OpgC domain-containing protein [Yinghuangia soli]|uniref:OpgC domain-containing protein n=1 Tax=Yinghuangia soli TaxID=2908204 RepID=A0AA41Q315_9ACTN|nr:OpgC domain-containing protein [Yinghuangia soli]MCF2530060.1 OpgC domain-containing protein [Yinghuangia soli]
MAHGVSVHGPDCHCVVREEYRRAHDGFAEARRALARREGVPAVVAPSELATRQWIDDELRAKSVDLAAKRRAHGRTALRLLGTRTLAVFAAAVVVLLVVQALTAIGTGWTVTRTAALAAAVVAVGALAGVAYWARASAGLYAPVRGLDGRLSTSKAIAGLWAVALTYTFVFFAVRLAAASDGDDRSDLLDSLGSVSADQIALFAAPLLAAVLVRRIVGDKVGRRVLQKPYSDRARLRDLVTDDGGRAALADAQYVLVNLVAVGFVVVGLARDPEVLPDIPATLVALAMVSVAVYVVAKLVENNRPVILSVVRVHVPGNLDTAVRQGDDIEIRGTNLAAAGVHEPDQLARVVVRFGAVHVYAPLVPTETGFANPCDAIVVVPIPVDVDPGRVELCVVTASGIESNTYEIEIAE